MKKIYMIGDSIMQTNKYNTYPQTGWGQVLYLFANEDVKIINLAKNGTSTKSFIDQGRFEYVKNNIKEDDLLIIGFAHNDEKIQDPLRYTRPFNEFKDNLKYFIDSAKKANAKVILCTPVVRRNFVDGILVETHGEYVDAIKESAKENNISLADLNKLSFELVSSLKEDGSLSMYMNFNENVYSNFPKGNNDNSHLRIEGAINIARLFVSEVYKNSKFANDYFLELPSEKNCASDTYEK